MKEALFLRVSFIFVDSSQNCKEGTFLFHFGHHRMYNTFAYDLWVVLREIHEGKEVKPMLFAPKEKGQGLVEYALILVLVAIVVIAVLLILGPIIGNVFTKINSSLVHE
jgi:pilus assembly protein Flp/PilA